uniref:Uncharacterized protein n=2 Tax=Triticum TaxID=4564 RepID=A0A8R7U1D0_TRIUA
PLVLSLRRRGEATAWRFPERSDAHRRAAPSPARLRSLRLCCIPISSSVQCGVRPLVSTVPCLSLGRNHDIVWRVCCWILTPEGAVKPRRQIKIS